MDGVLIFLLVAGPAAIGITALVMGIILLKNSSKPTDDGEQQTNHALTAWGVLLLLVALGIGSCYAMMATM